MTYKSKVISFKVGPDIPPTPNPAPPHPKPPTPPLQPPPVPV